MYLQKLFFVCWYVSLKDETLLGKGTFTFLTKKVAKREEEKTKIRLSKHYQIIFIKKK